MIKEAKKYNTVHSKQYTNSAKSQGTLCSFSMTWNKYKARRTRVTQKANMATKLKKVTEGNPLALPAEAQMNPRRLSTTATAFKKPGWVWTYVASNHIKGVTLVVVEVV
jgi:hypothetical protein